MKKIILPLVLAFLSSCSVEKDEVNESQIESSNLNGIVEIEGCEVESYNFENVGKIEVTNDTEKVYITIAATAENFDLVSSKLHVAISESDFPTVGQGNLPPDNMEYIIELDSHVRSHTFEFPIEDLVGCIYIASQSTFSNGEELVTTWVGDINVKYGNWSYFQYCIQECIPACTEPVYTGPSVLSGSINYTEAKTIPSVDEARKLFSNLIIQTGKYLGSGHDFEDFTRYNPRIPTLVTEFNSRNEPFETYDLETTYSYGTGECAGTIKLIITVIDDRIIE